MQTPRWQSLNLRFSTAQLNYIALYCVRPDDGDGDGGGGGALI